MDQICYSVLCVFSYVAAGQDHKKNPVVITEQIQELHSQQIQQKGSHSTPQKPPSSLVLTQKTPSQPLPQQPASKLTTTVTVKQPTIPTTTTTPAQSSTRSNHLPSTRTVVTTTSPPTVTTSSTKTQLPKVPPRLPSQNSTESNPSKPRGPPPAIPPRSGTIQRCESVQVGGSPQPATRKSFQRQASANAITPQFKPQPPPAFVIPQRRNSLSRQNTYSSSASPPNEHKNGGNGNGNGGFSNKKH